MGIKEALGGVVLSLASIVSIFTGEINVRHFTDISRANDPILFWAAIALLVGSAGWFVYQGFFVKNDS